MQYCLKPGYRERETPSYFVDSPDDAIACQPDVYDEARELAAALGAAAIIDLGCGIGDKLAALAPDFAIVGVDHGENLEVARIRHEVGRWVDWDLEQPGLELSEARHALILCVDVIEHMRRPERLLRLARRLLDVGALALVLTTPERDLVRGEEDIGPPENESHAREWNRIELMSFLRQEGIAGYVGLTRSNTSVPWFHTTLVVAPGASADTNAVAQWWLSRERYERPIGDLQQRLRASEALATAAAEREQLLFAELGRVQAYVEELETERDRLLAQLAASITLRSASRLVARAAASTLKRRLGSPRA